MNRLTRFRGYGRLLAAGYDRELSDDLHFVPKPTLPTSASRP
jgi:hypothetical protein